MHKSNALLNAHFADDTTGLCKGKNLNEMVPFLNQELQKIGVWLRSHKLSINAGKTKVMIFHSRGKNVDPNLNFVFDNNNDLNCSINPVAEFKEFERRFNLSRVLNMVGST